MREIRSLFLSNGRCCRFSAGEQIWVKDSEARVLYYLERGKVRAYYIYPDGTDRTLCFVGRGNLVGEEVMAHPPLRIDYVDAVTDVLLYSLDHDTLMALLLQSPAALDGLMALFVKKIELLCSWIFYAQFRQNSEKLACFLYYSTKDGPRVDYTQQQIADKLDKGLLDFLVLAETPDGRKYEYIEFPESDTWGLIIPENDPLAEKTEIRPEDLAGLPLFASEQAWNHEIREWAGNAFARMKLEGTFRLAYNGSIFAREGLGYLLTFEHLINTSAGSGLVFRPLSPRAETRLYIAWNRYQTFTPIAGKFLSHLQESFRSPENG